MERKWTERVDSGSLCDVSRQGGDVVVGWYRLVANANHAVDREHLTVLYQVAEPYTSHGMLMYDASQVWRLVNNIQGGEWEEQGVPVTRKVRWNVRELPLDCLGSGAKNSLGSSSILFEVPRVAYWVLTAVQGKSALIAEGGAKDVVNASLSEINSQAVERIKDRVIKLDWGHAQHSVAEILRAEGYRSELCLSGLHRGKYIVAPQAEIGFEHPRIAIDLIHRKEQGGSQEARSFLYGGYKPDLRLYSAPVTSEKMGNMKKPAEPPARRQRRCWIT